MLPLIRTNTHDEIAFLRLMVCVLFLPCFLLMDKTLSVQVYFVSGAALLYAAALYLFPSLNKALCLVFPFSLVIDLVIISLLLYYCDKYTAPLSIFYLLPVIAISFNPKQFVVFMGPVLSASAYLSIILIRKEALAPALIQIIIFFIIAFFTRFLAQYVHQTYFRQANLDILTKIHNRRFFNHALNRIVNTKTPFSLILVDIDNFKNLNDTQGHHHGDYVLKIIASILKEHTRSSDIVARYGGDEFAIILPNSSKEAGKNIAERIRNNVLVNPKLMPYSHISVSLGIAAFPADAENDEDILKKADEALYMAKGMGKNYVYIY